MDPFIEACGLWEDFHSHLIEKIGEKLADTAPDHYLVRTGERSYVVLQEEHRETFIEIIEPNRGQRLVTTVEVLSPSNERPGTEGWELYQRKRQSLLLGNVSLIEIDLVRRGQRMPMLDPWRDSPYTLLVARAGSPFCRVWRAQFRRPLPSIPVPLAKPDPDTPLEIQPLIVEIYDRFRYERSIDYKKPLTPSLPAADMASLKQQLRARAGRR